MKVHSTVSIEFTTIAWEAFYVPAVKMSDLRSSLISKETHRNMSPLVINMNKGSLYVRQILDLVL